MSNAWIAWKNRLDFSLKTAAPIAVFLFLGMLPGTMALQYADSWIRKAGLGALCWEAASTGV